MQPPPLEAILDIAYDGMLVLRNEGCYRCGRVEVFAPQAIEGVLDALLGVWPRVACGSYVRLKPKTQKGVRWG